MDYFNKKESKVEHVTTQLNSAQRFKQDTVPREQSREMKLSLDRGRCSSLSNNVSSSEETGITGRFTVHHTKWETVENELCNCVQHTSEN